MPLTLLQLQEHVEAVVGASTDARLSVNQIINEAGRLLFNMHPWTWRRRPPARLSLVADQSYVALPSDFGFGELIEVTLIDTTGFDINVVTLSDIEKLRSWTVTDTTHFYYVAVAFPTQSATTSAPGTARLEIYPTPATNQSNVIGCVYRAGWVELSAATAVPNIPTAFDHLLLRLVRAMAVYYKTENYDGVEKILTSQSVAHMKMADARTQADLGRMQGGQLHDSTGQYPWSETVRPPIVTP